MDGSLSDKRMRPYPESRIVSPSEIVDKPQGYAMASMMFRSEIIQEIAEILCKLPGGGYAIAADGGGHRIWLLHGSDMSVYRFRRGSVLDQSGKIRGL